MIATLERVEPIVSLLPEDIASEILHRPRGGRRRADATLTRPSRALDLVPGAYEARHCKRPSAALVHRPGMSRDGDCDGLLIDAFDAASFIALRCRSWGIDAILAHDKIAVMAVQEAEERMAEERRRLALSRLGSRRAWRRYADLGDEQVELDASDRRLAEVQATGLLNGY